jgi:hypothetical protein
MCSGSILRIEDKRVSEWDLLGMGSSSSSLTGSARAAGVGNEAKKVVMAFWGEKRGAEAFDAKNSDCDFRWFIVVVVIVVVKCGGCCIYRCRNILFAF